MYHFTPNESRHTTLYLPNPKRYINAIYWLIAKQFLFIAIFIILPYILTHHHDTSHSSTLLYNRRLILNANILCRKITYKYNCILKIAILHSHKQHANDSHIYFLTPQISRFLRSVAECGRMFSLDLCITILTSTSHR